MAAALAIPESLKGLGKTELAKKVVNFKAAMARYRVKEHATRGAKCALGVLVAGGGGAVAGAMQLKLPYLYKNLVRTDLVAAGGLALGCAANLFDDATPWALDFAKGIAGAGMAEVSKNFLKKHGLTQVSGDDLL